MPPVASVAEYGVKLSESAGGGQEPNRAEGLGAQGAEGADDAAGDLCADDEPWECGRDRKLRDADLQCADAGGGAAATAGAAAGGHAGEWRAAGALEHGDGAKSYLLEFAEIPTSGGGDLT